MFFRIMLRDLKRKKTMNIILFMFIILASMFVASGLNNVITVANGTDYYLDQAGVGEVTFMAMDAESIGAIDEYLSNNNEIEKYTIEPIVIANKENILLENGEFAYTKNNSLFLNADELKLNYYDSDNKIINSMEPGHIMVSGKFMEKNNLKVGDKVRIKYYSIDKEFIFDGMFKDALLGSDFMGNTKVIFNKADFNSFLENEDIYSNFRGVIAYGYLKDGGDYAGATANAPGQAFARSTIKMCYVMDMVVAFVVLILSICLIVVSFVVLKFSIDFSIREEFREIGVMKAIGLKNKYIRAMYLSKNFCLALLGSAIGLVVSIPFGKMLIKSVSENMMLGNSMGIIANVIGSISVVLIIILFAYRCTGKVKKATPIDAIRSGQTGERYKKKTVYRIGKSHTKPNMYMAINDILSSPKRFLSIIISFTLCTLFVLVLVNLVETLNSDKLIDTFGARSDIYVADHTDEFKETVVVKRSKEACKEYLDKRAKELTDMGMPAKGSMEILYNCTVTFNGKEYSYICQQGVNADMSIYKIEKGTQPKDASEIAITPQVSERTGAQIGDIITIDFGPEKKDCMVTAIFQTMNQLGEEIRLHPDAEVDSQKLAGNMQVQFTFTDNPSQKEIDRRRDELKIYFDTDEVMNASEFCVDCTNVYDLMRSIQFLLLGLTIVVIILVTILMERSFIADEKSQIAILKAIGFKSGDVIRWQVYRFALVALVSAVLAGVLSIPVTKLCITPIFAGMGASHISYNIVVWKVFGLYPAIVVGATVAIAFITALYTRTITSRDTAGIE